jgi:hypothetical protein
LTPAQSTEYDGIGKVVVDPNGLKINGNFQSFSAVGPIATPGAISTYPDGAIVSVGQASASGLVVVGSATLSIGQSTSIAGVGNVLVEADALVVNGKSTLFSALSNVATAGGGYYVVAGLTITAHATSAISLAPDATLWAGGPAVSLSGHVYSMGPSGAYIVADGTTRWPTPAVTDAPAFTLGGTTYTANQATGFVIDGTTLSRGGAVIVDGTTVSLDPSGQYVVVDGVTQSIAAPFATATTTLDRETSGTVHESTTGTFYGSEATSAVVSSALSTMNGKSWAMMILLLSLCALSLV